MDISPPTASAEISTDALLHSITLPFTTAVYRVGEVDSLTILGLLINGDTIVVDPAQITWKGTGPQLPIWIDSAGVLRVQGYSSGAVMVTASYQSGEITHVATASIYLTQHEADIQSVTFRALDSSQVGYMAGSLFFGAGFSVAPRYSLVVRDTENQRPTEFPETSSFVVPFLTNAETGLRIPLNFNLLLVYQDTIFQALNTAIPRGRYWLGISTYLNGKQYIDSVPFTILPFAELFFQATSQNGQLTIDTPETWLQPCAFFFALNNTTDTISVEFSNSTPDQTCDGEPTEGGPITIPPLARTVVRKLGYSVGQTVTWSATVKGKPAAPITGMMHFVTNEDSGT